jgi:hypothetical protein
MPATVGWVADPPTRMRYRLSETTYKFELSRLTVLVFNCGVPSDLFNSLFAVSRESPSELAFVFF